MLPSIFHPLTIKRQSCQEPCENDQMHPIDFLIACPSGFTRGTNKRRNDQRFMTNQNSCWHSDNFMQYGLLDGEMYLHRWQYMYNACANASTVRRAGRWNYRDWRSTYRNNNSHNAEKTHLRSCVRFAIRIACSRTRKSKNLNDLSLILTLTENDTYYIFILLLK